MHELLTRTLDTLRDAWRFRWQGALVAWIICIVGWFLVYSLPSVYQVEARVRIDTTSVIQPLIGDLTVTPTADWKVNLLIHTVLSNPNLKQIARSTGMAINATTPAAEQQMVAQLENGIDIDSEQSGINLYSISYTASDPAQAQAVVQGVIDVMTGMALGNSVHESQRAMDFLSRKVNEYRDKLHAIQAKLTQFKKSHPDLAKGPKGYISRLQTIRAVVAQMKTKLKVLQNKRASLQEHLQELAHSSIALPASRSPKVQALNQRIAQYQAELSQLLTRYTQHYPGVKQHKAIIDRLQQKRQQLMAQLQANPRRIPGTSTAEYGQVQQRLNQLEIKIDTLQSQIERKTAQINVLESNSDEATGAQAKLAALSRNYTTTRKQYEMLLQRLNSARLSKDIASFGDRLHFQIIDPPVIPDTPTGPPRVAFMIVVLLAGLAGGAIFSLFLSQIRPVFMTRRQLMDVTGMPVLGAVSMAWSMNQRLRRRSGLGVFAVVIGTLVAGFVAAVALMSMGVHFVPSVIGHEWL